MAMDKGIYQAPMGIAATEELPVEIEILGPDEEIGETTDGIENEGEGY